jgi:ribosome biogenesis GTPase A
MFALLYNLYKYLKERTERRVCIIVLGVDNAGKTTLINSLMGEEVSWLLSGCREMAGHRLSGPF